MTGPWLFEVLHDIMKEQVLVDYIAGLWSSIVYRDLRAQSRCDDPRRWSTLGRPSQIGIAHSSSRKFYFGNMVPSIGVRSSRSSSYSVPARRLSLPIALLQRNWN